MKSGSRLMEEDTRTFCAADLVNNIYGNSILTFGMALTRSVGAK